ncbi:hypothetical protein MKW98_023245 [Papaver atlanticum]|uniref:Uncharacterized protein n=1 Tax=Papaver atlanticum TaxID=357466 RepID=A0AAD4T9U0_9MAGN|nr:hypothetical protein MKW98_023245 [Papaver atlanticum]
MEATALTNHLTSTFSSIHFHPKLLRIICSCYLSQFNRTVTACVSSVNGGVEQTVKDVAPIEKQFPAYPTVMYINKIREIQPHSDNFFPPHFPERPIKPGVLICSPSGNI